MSISIFIGNTEATKLGSRSLGNQPDYNRVWVGAGSAGKPEHEMMKSIVHEMKTRNVFA